MKYPLAFRRGPALGQSLTEYALIAGLVGVVSIGALVVLGQQLQQFFGSAQEVWMADGAGSTAPAVGSPNPPIGVPLAPGLGVNLSLGDGLTVSLPNYPQVPGLVETVGIDGTTNLYAESLEQLAQQLLDAEAIDADTAALIRQLADGGFALAAQQREIQTAFEENRTSEAEALIEAMVGRGATNLATREKSEYLALTPEQGTPAGSDSSYVENGTYGVGFGGGLGRHLNDYVQALLSGDPLPKNRAVGPTIQQMAETYQALVNEDMMTNPTVRQLVDDALGNILTITQETGNLRKVTRYLEGPTVISNTHPNRVVNTVDSNVKQIRSESGTICHTHQANVSTGLQCMSAGG